jgi:hypothetical protein
MLLKFIFIGLITSTLASDYIRLHKKWVQRTEDRTDYHKECQKQYNHFKDVCPAGWKVEVEYMNFEIGAVIHYRRALDDVILNCELLVLCEVPKKTMEGCGTHRLGRVDSINL